MTLQEAKNKATKDGSVKISSGVYLITGSRVLEETATYRKEMDTDEISNGYTVADVYIDELYIQTNDGNFGCPTDSEIKVMLAVSNAASLMGRKGGSSKSEAKKKASAENGKLGGRPKKLH